MKETPQPERTREEEIQRVKDIRQWNKDQVRGYAELVERSKKSSSRMRVKQRLQFGPGHQ